MIRVTIELEIDGDDADERGADLVDSLLDAGLMQDAINDNDEGLALHVRSAVVRMAEAIKLTPAHCTGGCGDIEAFPSDLQAGRCRFCGGDLETASNAETAE